MIPIRIPIQIPIHILVRILIHMGVFQNPRTRGHNRMGSHAPLSGDALARTTKMTMVFKANFGTYWARTEDVLAGMRKVQE